VEAKTKPQFTCPLSGFQKVINGKHKLRIIWALKKKPLWYGELKREVSIFSEFPMVARILSRELKALDDYGIVNRKPLDRRVEYSLTETGKALLPLIGGICDWSLASFDITTPGPVENETEKCIS
jgi:DNA-binding HxlR family transcriptional regulator